MPLTRSGPLHDGEGETFAPVAAGVADGATEGEAVACAVGVGTAGEGAVGAAADRMRKISPTSTIPTMTVPTKRAAPHS